MLQRGGRRSWRLRLLGGAARRSVLAGGGDNLRRSAGEDGGALAVDGGKEPSANTTGSGSYESNLTDFSIEVVDVMARYSAPKLKSAGYESELKLDFIDVAGRCADEAANVRHPSSKRIEIELTTRGATAAEAELKPGTRAFSKLDDDLYLGRGGYDATCKSVYASLPFDYSAATVNQLVITSFTGTHVAGTYELRAADGRFVKGAFDAEICTSKSSAASTCE